MCYEHPSIPAFNSPAQFQTPDTSLSTSDSTHVTKQTAEQKAWSHGPVSMGKLLTRTQATVLEMKTLPQSPSSSSDGPVADGEKTRQDETQSQSSAVGNQNPNRAAVPTRGWSDQAFPKHTFTFIGVILQVLFIIEWAFMVYAWRLAVHLLNVWDGGGRSGWRWGYWRESWLEFRAVSRRDSGQKSRVTWPRTVKSCSVPSSEFCYEMFKSSALWKPQLHHFSHFSHL